MSAAQEAALTVPCVYCGAQLLEPCLFLDGYPRTPHESRVSAAQGRAS